MSDPNDNLAVHRDYWARTQANLDRLEAELRACRSALLDAVAAHDTDNTWRHRHVETIQAALDSESAHNNVDDGDLYGRSRPSAQR